jgi:hypothetical protein
MVNSIIGVGLILWGLILVVAGLAWLDTSAPDVGKRISVIALGGIMFAIGIARLASKNISRRTANVQRTREPTEAKGAPGDFEENQERAPPTATDADYGTVQGSFPTKSGFSIKLLVCDHGFKYFDGENWRKYSWVEIAIVQYWDTLNGMEIRVYPKQGREIHLTGATSKFGNELGTLSRADISELLDILQTTVDRRDPPLEVRRTPFSLAISADGRAVEAPFLIQSFGVISILFSWFPFIGLCLALLAILLNRRIGGWGKVTSWIGFGLSLLSTIGCLIPVGLGLVQNWTGQK